LKSTDTSASDTASCSTTAGRSLEWLTGDRAYRRPKRGQNALVAGRLRQIVDHAQRERIDRRLQAVVACEHDDGCPGAGTAKPSKDFQIGHTGKTLTQQDGVMLAALCESQSGR
jgi:hypothetical protein